MKKDVGVVSRSPRVVFLRLEGEPAFPLKAPGDVALSSCKCFPFSDLPYWARRST